MKKLDLIDRKVLYYLDQNSRAHLSVIAKKVKISKESLHYRIKRLVEKGYISKFYTIINPAKFGYYFFKIYVQLQNTNEQSEKEIMEYLYSHPRYGWSCFSSGRWDMLVGVWAEDPLDFDSSFMDGFQSHFGKYIASKEVSITKHNIQQNRRWGLNTREKPVSVDVGGKAGKIELDETDTEILRILANNARIPITRIAQLAKTTPNVVSHRIKRMEKEEVILAYRINFDLEKYGYEFCKSFIYLKNMEPKRMEEFLAYCKEHSNVLNIVTVFGSWDVELEFEVPNFEYFHTAMKEIRNRFSDLITKYDSVLISKEYKVDFMPGCYPSLHKTEKA